MDFRDFRIIMLNMGSDKQGEIGVCEQFPIHQFKYLFWCSKLLSSHNMFWLINKIQKIHKNLYLKV